MNPFRRMSFSKRSRAVRGSAHFGQILLTAVLAVGLSLTGIGCDSGGSNEEPTPPAAPSGLEATSGNAQITLNWEAVSEAETYNVYRSTSSTNGAEGSPHEENLSSENYNDTSVENGTSYYYRVTAVDSDGVEGDASGEEEVTPFDEPPSRPE